MWTLGPLYWMVTTSFKTNAEVYGTTATLWPRAADAGELPGPVHEDPLRHLLPEQRAHRARHHRRDRLHQRLRRLCPRPACASRAGASWRGPSSTPTWCRNRSCSSPAVPILVNTGLSNSRTGRALRTSGSRYPSARGSSWVLPVGAGGARGGGAGGRLQPPRCALPDRHAGDLAGARGDGVLLVHAVVERVPLRLRVRLRRACQDDSHRHPELHHRGRVLRGT